MFCRNCGNQLPDGSRFCSRCGADLGKRAAAPGVNFGQRQNVKIQPPPQGVRMTPPPQGVGMTPPPQSGRVQPPLQVGGMQSPPVKKQKMKKSGKKAGRPRLIGISIAGVVLIAAAVAAAGVFFGWFHKEKAAYAYFSDGRYELITNLNRGDTVEIGSCRGSSDYPNWMFYFSPDGKYVYYMSKFDKNEWTGTLCRAEYGKLRKDSGKNEKYIEVIDSGVQTGVYFVGGSDILYQKNEGALYYYNGGEPVRVARNVESHWNDDNGRILYMAEEKEERYTLYGVKTADIEDKVKLASGVEDFYGYSDFDHIFYGKDGDLYVTAFGGKSEKLADDAYVREVSEGKVYYTVSNGSALNLYDYVTDSNADADTGLPEQKEEDFTTPVYSYSMVSVANPSESSYEELYTSCVVYLYWYRQNGAGNMISMESAVSGGLPASALNLAEITAATQAFIDKFGSQADSDGYILVTEEVKEGLKAISRCGSNATENSWLWLCCTRYQTGSDVDRDAYYTAYEEYEKADRRDDLREELKKKENEYPVSTLYCYDNGTTTTINENVVDCRNYSGILLYNTTDMITDKIDLEKVTGSEDVKRLFRLDFGAQNYLVAIGGETEEIRVSTEAAEAMKETMEGGYAELYYSDHSLYMLEEEDELSVASVSGGSVGSFSAIDDEVYSVGFDASWWKAGDYGTSEKIGGKTGVVYYIKDVYDDYGTLYSYADGKSKRVLQDVYVNGTVQIYRDGAVLAYTDDSDEGYEITLVSPDGEAARVAEDVTQHVRIGESAMLYISEGDLYYYNGKEKRRIAGGVDWIWALNTMEIFQYVY